MGLFRHLQPKTTAAVMYIIIIASSPLTVLCLLQTNAPNLPNNLSGLSIIAMASTSPLHDQTDSKELKSYSKTQTNETSVTIRTFTEHSKLSTCTDFSTNQSCSATNEESIEERPKHGEHTIASVKKEKHIHLINSGNQTQKSASPFFHDFSDENSTSVSTASMLEKPLDELTHETYQGNTISFSTYSSNTVTSFPPWVSGKSFLSPQLQSTSNREVDNDDPGLSKLRQNLHRSDNISENDAGVGALLRDSSLNRSVSIHTQSTEITTVAADDDIDPALVFTCKGRCDMKISFPCSCSATCVVYGTCCENLSQDCPHVWGEGRLRFDHFRGADFVCDKDLRMFKIVSCPNSVKEKSEHKEIGSSNPNMPRLRAMNSQKKVANTISETNNLTSFNSTSLTESVKQRLIDALSSVPVTDSNTGFTFISKAVYNCLNMSAKTAVPWSLKLDYNFISPVKLEDVNNFQKLEEYYPNFDKNVFIDHLCVPNIVDTCKKTANLENLNEKEKEKCENSTAIVISKKPRITVYRNQFCAYCNKGRHHRYYLLENNKVPIREPDFFVLMSLSESNTFSFRLMFSSLGRLYVKFPWSHAQCSIPDQAPVLPSSLGQMTDLRVSKSEKNSVCSVTCGSGFTVGTDGICRTRHVALLAIADDGLEPLCPSAITGLADFFVCGLKSEIESLRKADLSAPWVKMMFDSKYNKSLYVLKVYMALPERSGLFLSNSREEAMTNIRHVALLSKSLQDYRLSQSLCPQMTERFQNNYTKFIQTLSLVTTTEWLIWYKGFYQGMEELRGPIVDNQNTSTVCLSNVYNDGQIDPNLIKCMDDPVYERDAAWISKFRNSPCFSHLDNLQSLSSNSAFCIMKNHEISLELLLFLYFLQEIAFEMIRFE